ncbi:4Fe-4S cluster-binding domain-containing protein [Candidatus Pacearchaeota archaeon]|nr:4Fe-4S cluster-binding domain-containing protein [Candidatus Pacearchaeota archaeon]
MKIQNKIKSEISTVNKELRKINPSLTVLDLFNFMRQEYLKQALTDELKSYIKSVGTEMPLSDLTEKDKNQLRELIKKRKLNWEDITFHLRYRITNFSDLFNITRTKNGKDAKESIKKGFLISLLPLNMVLPAEVRKKFIPEADYFTRYSTSNPDPYGLFTKKTKILDKKTKKYLASRKFPHSALMNIIDICPIGCVGCYKSAIGTRERKREINLGLALNPERVIKQTKMFVEWLNKNPTVYDIILSGGEPLMYGNPVIKEMFKIFKKAKYLRIIRICTAVIFMGLPFRINNKLLETLQKFSEETGIRITFNTHLSNHYQITPEALIAVHKIKKAGFNIYSQVPIQEGINFFRDDQFKTIKFWVELGKRQVVAGVEPYKFIVDMHPRTQKRYVPFEELLKVWSIVEDSHDYPELQRPRTLSILSAEGNIILSDSDLFATKKQVDKKSKIVRYTIPTIFSGEAGKLKIERINTFIEPLIKGVNDYPDSLYRLRQAFFKDDNGKSKEKDKRA